MAHRVPQPRRAYEVRVPASGAYGVRVPASGARTAHHGTPGGSKDAAEELLVEVLAELKTMETADWGLMDTQETQPAAGDTKFYSGL